MTHFCFELPPLGEVSSFASQMHGMDKRFVDHVWNTTNTSNIRNGFAFVFKKSLCDGHLQCQNKLCIHFVCVSKKNETNWNESTIS